jgi:hypothetical protein
MEEKTKTTDMVSETDTKHTKRQERYTKPTRDGADSEIDYEVDSFDYTGFEMVRRELFSKALCPAVTMKYGSVVFNARAVRRLSENRFVQILISPEEKRMIVIPCEEDDKDSIQWSKVDKHGKVVSRIIRGKYFTAQLFADMRWNFACTIKVLGRLERCGKDRRFVFKLIDAEMYMSTSSQSADDPKRRIREPLMPLHWQGHYGQTYEESRQEMIKTTEGVPPGFVKVMVPDLPSRKSTEKQGVAVENEANTMQDGTV